MSDSVEMSPELAQKLFENGSTYIFLGVPRGSEFGIDLKSWTTGEKFLGIKMIPPGFHYIHYRLSNVHGDIAPTMGFICNSDSAEIVVKKWSETDEKFIDESEETIDRLKSNLKTIDKNLGAYPYDVWVKWKNLTTELSDALPFTFVPDSGIISSVLDLKGISDCDRRSTEAIQKRRKRHSARFSDVEMYGDLLPEMNALAGTELRLSKFPELCYPPESNPSEITKHSLDSSYLLEQIIKQHKRPADILGEMQFSYVAFLVGHSMEGFEQWKRLLGLLCFVQQSLPKHTSIFSKLLTILKPQLEEIPEDFLVDIVSSNNFVYQSLRKLFRNISTESTDHRLTTKAQRLAESLTTKFLWDFEDLNEEEEDEKPVLVTL